MNRVTRSLTVKGGNTHNLTYIDIPPGAGSLTVTASGEDDAQNNDLEIELYRMSFDDAFVNVPFAATPDTSGNPLAENRGSGGIGPSVTVNVPSAGRWYAVLRNHRGLHTATEIMADVTFTGNAIPIKAGLWEPSSRLGLSQGYDYGVTATARAIIWYTYDEDGSPDWYLAAAPHQDGNIWVADLIRFTNDGLLQQENLIGHVSITTLAEDDNIFSWVLYGQNGSEREFPTAQQTCPQISGNERTYTGLWSRTNIGVGGASGLVNSSAQAFIHFLYDDEGNPRWLLAAPEPQSPTAAEFPLLQFSGYCAVCDSKPITNSTAGVFTRNFSDEDNMTWTLDYVWLSPLIGSITRTDETVKLTVPLDCQ
jgi:hypothetical protein